MAAPQNTGGPRALADLRVQVRAKRQLQIRRARRSAAAFIEYALRNEQDETRLENADFHLEWQELFEENRYVVLLASVEHGKTQQVVGKVLHMLGRNPNLRGALVSSTSGQAEKVLRQIRTHIESNPRVREVFPYLRPSTREEDPWHATQITCERTTISKDPTLQALGMAGPLVGSRLDFLILDDVEDFENTRTEAQRKKSIEWFDTTAMTRIVAQGIVWAIGTPWHPEDLLHELEKRKGFVSRRYSAVLNPDEPPHKWVPRWPQQWPLSRLLHRRGVTPEGVFSRKYLVRVRVDSTSRFRQLWIDRMSILGKGRTFQAEQPRQHARGPRLPCFTGVDLGAGKKQSNARTCIFTIALLRDSRRLIVDIESGHWQSPEIIDRLEGAYRRFDAEILVEDNGAQTFLIDMCKGRVPVHGWTTTARNKFDEQWGVESLAVEIRNGWWLLPSGRDGTAVPDEGKAWTNELLYYDPELHSGDRLMASWLARECARKYAGGMFGFRDTQRR